MNTQQCKFDECGGPAIAIGLCWKHYKRFKRHGDASVSMRRHKQPHECRHCGSDDPSRFYPGYRGICKGCQKVQTVQRFRIGATVRTLEKFVTSIALRDGA